MRGLRAIVRYVVATHLRRPLLISVGLVYVLIAANLPRIGDSGSRLGFRLAGSMGLGVGHLVLLMCSLILPLATARRLGRGQLGRTLPATLVQGGACLGHVLVLILAAILGAGVCLGLVGVEHGWPDRTPAPVALRHVIWTQGEDFHLDGAQPTRILHLSLSDRPEFAEAEKQETQPILRVRLEPRFRIARGERLEGSTLRVPVRVGLRAKGGRFENKEVPIRRGTPVEVSLPLPRGFRGGEVEIGLRRLTPGYALLFQGESVHLLGGPASFLASLFRGFLLLGLACSGLVAVTLWFARFTAYPIALLVGLTLALFSSAGVAWLPGAPLRDPGRLFAAGLAVSWSDLVPTAGLALAWLSCSLIPVREGRGLG